MITGAKVAKFAGIIVLCLGILSPASAATGQKKSKKAPLPPLPSGPTGPIPQIPLDSMAPVAPQVNYQNGQLTIMAPNSTLGDILRAVRKQTGAEIDVPDAKERVVTHLGPGPAREVIAELLNGSRFNYVLLGSPTDPTVLTRIVLVARAGIEPVAPANPGGQQQAILRQQGGAINPTPEQDMATDANDADAQPDETPAPEENVEQPAAETDQPVGQPDQPGVKTPQQLLQEMQQRQLQMQQQQQQQQSGQPPVPPGQPVQPPPQDQR